MHFGKDKARQMTLVRAEDKVGKEPLAWRCPARRGEVSMRLTPAQIGMHALLGNVLPIRMFPDQGLAERIRKGRMYLVRVSGVDLGYDPQAWHKHLCATDDGGYRWSNKHLGFPRRIDRALADPEWQAAVACLRAEQDS